MREIKFRAWDLESKKLKYKYVANDYSSLTDILELSAAGEGWKDKIILMQYTGLRDKNGNEIYEGDILRLDGTEEYENCTPKPKPGEYIGIFKVEHNIDWWGYSFDWIHISGYECSTHIMGNYDEFTFEYPNIEILGNIHETPNLLNP